MKRAFAIAALVLVVGCGKNDDAPSEKPKEKTVTTDTVVVAPKKEYPKRYKYSHDELLNAQSVGDRWKTYNSSRAQSKTDIANRDYESAIKNLLLAGEATMKLERPDIAAWQFNNAGKCAIDLFSKRVKYQSRVAKINSMPHGDEKVAYMKECQGAYEEELDLLIYGTLYLDLAQDLNEDDYNKGRFSAISNNKQFIKEVMSFTEKSF